MEDITREIDAVYWWHHINLGNGIITPGHQGDDDINERYLSMLQLPDLTGKTVLDIGCSDGFYSFECEKRGAAKVIAVDDPKINASRGFHVAKNILRSQVEFIPINLFDINPKEFGKFDIVLALGLIYHLKSFYIGLEIIKELTKELVIIQSRIDRGNDLIVNVTVPLNKHDHITWIPSLPTLSLVMEDIGFKITMKHCYGSEGVIIHGQP